MNASEHNSHALGALYDLMLPLGLTPSETGGSIAITGFEPLFPSPARLGEAFAVAAMAQAAGVAAIWKEMTGTGQDLSIDLRRAAHGINPEATFHPTLNGHPYPNWVGNAHPFGVFPFATHDGRWVYPSGVYPHQHFKYGNFFNCGISHAKIKAAIAAWDSGDLEDAAALEGLPLSIARTPEEWATHPQGSYLSQEPVISVRKIGASQPEPFAPAKRPLENIKVLSLTHAIAGPVVGRSLAEQGAHVLCVNSTDDFEHDWVYADANVGQRSTFLSLTDPEQNRICRELARAADVFVDSFRGRKIQDYGFSPEELAHIRPGIIVVSIRCYGWDGPWFERGGFDMNGSAVSGLAMLGGVNGMPALPPTGMLNDYITGYLGAAGVAAALLKRAREGGSYHVTVSLTRTAMWCLSLGLIPEDQRAFAKNPLQQIWNLPHGKTAELMHEMAQQVSQRLSPPEALVGDTPLGRLRRLAPAVRYSATPAAWHAPLLVPRGSSAPEWR